MITVNVNIVGLVEENQPNIVEARLRDAWGHEWTFVDKCAIFTLVEMGRDSRYPVPGVIACRIITREQDTQGQEVITIDTEIPWHVEAVDGETRFTVFPHQLSGRTGADMVTDWVIRPYQEADEEQVVALWHCCNLVAPPNDPRRDIQSKRRIQPELFLVGVLNDRVAATLMAGYEGHRGWLNYLAVAPELQRQGLGRLMVQAAEAALADLGCPKINLQVRASNAAVIEFYQQLGFTVDDVLSLGKRL